MYMLFVGFFVLIFLEKLLRAKTCECKKRNCFCKNIRKSYTLVSVIVLAYIFYNSFIGESKFYFPLVFEVYIYMFTFLCSSFIIYINLVLHNSKWLK